MQITIISTRNKIMTLLVKQVLQQAIALTRNNFTKKE